MAEPTKAELYTEAQALDIEGRSTMDKEELAAAIAEARAEPKVEFAVKEFEAEVEDLDESNDPEPEPESVEDPFAPAPTISEEPTTAGGLTFLTDRAQ